MASHPFFISSDSSAPGKFLFPIPETERPETKKGGTPKRSPLFSENNRIFYLAVAPSVTGEVVTVDGEVAIR
jgi:hypothetical protein